MAESWQTIEQAAVSLRLSVRTVNRHIVAGKLQSRLNDGRREVLVDTSTGAGAGSATIHAAVASPFADGPTASPSETADLADSTSVTGPGSHAYGQPAHPPSSTALTLDQETVLALADNAAEKADMAVTAYQALARAADTQTQQVRRNARFAWAAVAVMAVGGAGAVGLMTHRVSRLSVERAGLIDQVAERARMADKLSAEREALRVELETRQDALRAEATAAREQAARSEGRLAAFLEQEQARQTREAVMAATPPDFATSPFSQLSLTPLLDGLGSAPAAETAVSAPDEGETSAGVGSLAADMEARTSDVSPSPSDAPTGRSNVGAMEAELAAGSPTLATSRQSVELDKPDGSDTSDKSDTSVATGAPEAETPDDARRASTSDSKVGARKTRVAPPTSRPVTSRRKARVPAPRPPAPSDAASASTTDDR